MMNFWRATHAELFAEHFLCFYRSRSLQVCASGATEHSVLLFTAGIWHCLLLPRQKKPLWKLLPAFCAGPGAAQGTGGVPIPGNAQETCGCGTGAHGLVLNIHGGGWKFGIFGIWICYCNWRDIFVIEKF